MSIITIVIFVAILALGFLLILVMPKPTVSTYERRELAAFPQFDTATLFNGEYAKAINLYIADTFPFRDTLVTVGVRFNELKGVRFDDVKFYSGIENITLANQDDPPKIDTSPLPSPGNLTNSDDNSTSQENPQNTPKTPSTDDELTAPETPANPDTDRVPAPESPTRTEPLTVDEAEIFGEQVGDVFVVGDTGLDIFGGVPSNGERYAAALNYYREMLPEKVNVYNILVPTHSEFALPQKYRNMARSQENAITHIFSNLSDGIKNVNVYDSLYNHQYEYIYFRTDHHWTALGAYYAYLDFAAAADIKPILKEDLEYGKVDTFLGSYYAWTKDIKMQNNPDYVEYFRPHDNSDYSVLHYLADGTIYPGSLVASNSWDISSGYLIFINGDQPHTHITTPNKNGRKLMVFKESFGNAFVPFAAMHYEEIHVADIRYFPYNAVNFITEKGIDDVIFINNIFAAYTPVRISSIEKLAGR
ncbi:MAG: DHHW family protein [Oscillospiraceae bacterium]|nr:DHHW family protein [Oscillospiraceae bacterium]